MAATTVERVVAIASHLKGKNELVQIAIEDAANELAAIGVDLGHAGYERVQRYLAAHFATLDQRRPIAKRVASLQVDYQGVGVDIGGAGRKDLEATEYGQEALRLLKRIMGPSLMVIP